jgi:hypothetical protein
MADTYNVETPLGANWADSPQEVTALIARYMETDGASLLKVTVSKTHGDERTGTGEIIPPQEFWQQP